MMISSDSSFWNCLLWKSAPRIGISPRRGYFWTTDRTLSLRRPAMAKALAVCQLDRGGRAARAKSRDNKPFEQNRSREIEFRHLGADIDADFVFTEYSGRKGQPNAKLLIVDGDSTESLGDRNRKFTACEESGLFTTQCYQRGFGQNLHQTIFFQGIDETGPGGRTAVEAKECVDGLRDLPPKRTGSQFGMILGTTRSASPPRVLTPNSPPRL